MLLPVITSRTILFSQTVAILRLFARAFVLIACATALASPVILGQQTDNDDDVVTIKTDLRVFPIRVRDRRGTGGSRLTEQDLSLTDPDRVTAGLYLYPGADRVSLVFALDQSGSLRDVIFQQREAALALLKRFGERSQVAVIHFGERASLVAPFTRDLTAANSAFYFPARRNQRTAIFDAAAAAVSAFDTLPRFRSERRIVILISDGLDNASSTKATSIIQAASAKQISFYVIHLPLFEPRDGRLTVRRPANGFREIGEKTGGKYFLAGDARNALAKVDPDLAPVFQAIEEDLRSQYLLGYYAGEGARDGRDHSFTISLPSGLEYQLGGYGFSRKHKFFIKTPAAKPKP